MKERIPIMYDRELQPEWIDYALEESLLISDKDTLTQTLRAHLCEQIPSPTSLRKVISQLQLVVGARSSLSRVQLQSYYGEMSRLAPDQRMAVRFNLLVESTPFVAEVVQAIRKLHVVGVKEVSACQLYERMVAKYGDRGTIPRRVRYVLRTLVNFGIMKNQHKKWLVTNRDLLEQ